MIRINLAPPAIRPRRIRTSFLGVVIAVIYLLAVGAMAGYRVLLSREEAHLERAIETATRELAQEKAVLGRGAKVREELADLTKRVETIQDLTRNQAAAILIMDAFADVIPRDLWVTTVEGRGTDLRVAGSAFSATAVADFMSNLRSSGKFKDVEIVISKQDLNKTPSLVTFEVTCRFAI